MDVLTWREEGTRQGSGVFVSLFVSLVTNGAAGSGAGSVGIRVIIGNR